jgi:hypothetical protein
MKEGTTRIPVRRRLRAACLFLVLTVDSIALLLVISFFLIQSPSVVNRLAQVFEGRIGYRVHVEDISLSPSLRGTITGLEVRENGLLMSSRSVSIKGSLSPSLKTEVEELVLKEPRFQIELGKEKGEGDLGFLEKIPPVRLLRVEKGEAVITLPGQVVKLTGLDLTLKDFSPEQGGVLTAGGDFSVSSREEGGPKGKGKYSGSITLTGLLPFPSAEGSLQVFMDNASYGTADLRGVDLKLSFRTDAERITVSSASFLLEGMTYGETALEALKGEAACSYDLKTGDFSASLLRGEMGQMGEFRGSVRGTARGDFPWESSLTASAMDLASVFGLARPYLPEEYREWLFEGKGDLEVDLKGNYRDKALSWAGRAVLEVKEGGFVSPDGSRAGQGLTGKMILKLESPPEGKRADFEASSELNGGELLIGKYYRAFSEGDVVLSTRGGFFLDTLLPLDVTGRVSLFGVVDSPFSGVLEKDRWRFSVEAKEVSLEGLHAELVSGYFGRDSPLAALQVEGHGDLSLNVLKQGEEMAFEGSLGIRAASAAMPEGSLSVKNLDVTLPFDLAYPPAEGAEHKGQKEGAINVEYIGVKGMELQDVSILLVLMGNTLSIPQDLEFEFSGGRLTVQDFRAERLLSPSMTLGFGLSLKGVDMGMLTENAFGRRISGGLDADFPSVRYGAGRWTATGGITTGVFDGTVKVSGIFAEKVFSESRAFGADVSFEGINLGKATEKFQLGRAGGVIRGSLTDFSMEYGQPASFVLEVESVKTRGAEQSISVDAIENLSILGTGSAGISRALSSGINSFFKEYRYRKIGFRCTLKNDVLTLRGTIHKGGTEYLVWRGLLWGVNVINQNPDNMIRFKDMQKRIKRIFEAKKSEIIVK